MAERKDKGDSRSTDYSESDLDHVRIDRWIPGDDLTKSHEISDTFKPPPPEPTEDKKNG